MVEVFGVGGDCNGKKQMWHEKTVNSATGKEHFVHPRVRAAYGSLQTNLPSSAPVSFNVLFISIFFIVIQYN